MIAYDIRKGVTKTKTRIATAITGVSVLTVSLLASVLVPMAAKAAPLMANGNFETPPATIAGSYTNIDVSSLNQIPGWQVKSGDIDYITTYWTNSGGSNGSVDLSGYNAGAISQALATVAGHTYTVSFDMSGNPDGGSKTKVMNVDSGGAPTQYTFDTTSHSVSDMGWTNKSYNFTATGSVTNLTFASSENDPFGPALDNVSISTNPPTMESQCDHNGWKDFTNPAFTNEGQCERFVENQFKFTCPEGKEIVNVNFKLVNDYDSAVGGNAWANDTIHRHIKIWKLKDGNYCAVVKDNGSFVTFSGNSPNGSSTVSAGILGKMGGGGTFGSFAGTAVSHPTYAKHGFLGTFDLACGPSTAPGYTCSDNRPTVSSYVTGGDYVKWGWHYSTCGNGRWVNASTGNYGDITGSPSANNGKCFHDEDKDNHQDHDLDQHS